MPDRDGTGPRKIGLGLGKRIQQIGKGLGQLTGKQLGNCNKNNNFLNKKKLLKKEVI